MGLNLADSLLGQVSDSLTARIGLYFPKDQWEDLERGLGLVSADLGFTDVASCALYLASADLSRPQIEVLATRLTIGETYFFREPRSFAALSDTVLPELIKARRAGRRALNLWSAACCTGEEAYSLAILLDQSIPDIGEWDIHILGTDINPGFLRRAAEARYGEWSFRGVDPVIRDRYFRKQPNNTYQVVERIRSMVSFSFHNLVETVPPFVGPSRSVPDIILCRNVLMYFSPEQAKAVVGSLYHVLEPGGWLVPSAVDGAPPSFAPFTFITVEGATLYRKCVAATPVEQPPWIEPGPVASWDVQAPPGDPAPLPIEFELPEVAPAKPIAADLEAASSFYAQGRYGEAAAILLRHLAVVPDDLAAMLMIARTYANQGRFADAGNWGRRLLKLDRLRAPNHYLLAMICQECGDLGAAAASLQRALFLDPNFVMAHFASANLARLEGRARDARKHYQNTLALLDSMTPDEILPESEGLTVGRLRGMARHADAMIGNP